MYLLTKENALKVAGGCLVTVGNYQFDPVGVDCGFAHAMADVCNYDLQTSGLIGYQPNGNGRGYSLNNPHVEKAWNCMNFPNWGTEYRVFMGALNQALPAYLIA